MTSTRAILRLLWSPRALADAADRGDDAISLLLGAMAGSLMLGLPLLALLMGVGEPYPTVAAYLDVPFHWPSLMLLGVVFYICLLVAGVVWLAVANHRVSDTNPRAFARALMLTPVPFVLIVAAWTPFIALAALSDPSLSIIAGVPAWMKSDVIVVIGSPWWGVALFIAMGWTFLAANRELIVRYSAPRETNCPRCDYSLKGLNTSTCPECGTTLSPNSALSAPSAVNPS